MLLGGAAVHRGDNDLISDPASAAEVTKIAREQLFHDHQPTTRVAHCTFVMGTVFPRPTMYRVFLCDYDRW